MAREALRALSRQRLTYADIPDFFDMLKSETERMGAILAAAGVEDGLEYAIQNQFMRELSKDEFRMMFDSDDMLSTFGAKIKMGHALGLYGDVTRADLNCIKDIRNVFAHAKMKLDFSHSHVSDACKQLKGPHGQSTQDKDLWSPYERFMKCAQYLYLELLDVATRAIPERERPGLP